MTTDNGRLRKISFKKGQKQWASKNWDFYRAK